MFYIVIGIVFILMYIGLTFNALIQRKNRVKEAFSTMDIYMKKRWDLIPNLIETVKGYVKDENYLLKEVTRLRSEIYEDMDDKAKINTEKNLAPKINKILILTESYPELKANKNFEELSKSLIKIEEDIANARKYYNGCVRILNNKIEKFPSNLVAKLFKIKEEKMFEINDNERKNVKVEF